MKKTNYRPEELEAFYSKDAAPEWERLVRTPEQEVKLHVHNHYLQAHLARDMDVLETGAGPGRFVGWSVSLRGKDIGRATDGNF